MSGNRMAYPLLISLANIDSCIRSKTSLHAYLLLALLPIVKFTHKNTRIRGLLQDRLVHQALNVVLSPLKTAAAVGVMMSDPRGNLRYCYTPLAAWIADTPEEALLAATGAKASPVTTAISKDFGDAYRHPSRTGENTLTAIRTACSQHAPTDYKNFLKVIKRLHLNGVTDPCWKRWLLSDPSEFFTPEVLHHFHRMSWDHNVKWCIAVTGAAELDFRFSLVQTLVGYRAFSDGISKLKQVTGRDHRSVQRYLIGAVAGSVPRRFLIAIRALLDFRYLAQAPSFTTQSIESVASALQEFHDHKQAILDEGVRSNWHIPKLELLQSVVPSISQSGAVMQWSADVTEHAHVSEIKVPAHSGNNQNYYGQITRHLDRLDKCFRFDLATYIAERADRAGDQDDNLSDSDSEEHEPDAEMVQLSEYHTPVRRTPNYFSISSALLLGAKPSAPRPYRTFATSTTGFHLAIKPSLRVSVHEAATLYQLPGFKDAIAVFFTSHGLQLPIDRLQVWHKIRVQQLAYHDRKTPLAPQTLCAVPPSNTNRYGQHDAVIISPQLQSDWPKSGLKGHSVAQLRIIFRLIHSDLFLAYVQHFTVATHSNPNPASGLHKLQRATRRNGERIGEVILLTQIRSSAHLIPNFGNEAHSRLTNLSSYELTNEFWLNKYWTKELYYALSSS